MPDSRRKALTLVACILGSAVVFVDQTVVNVALPAMRADLDASLADQQWVVEAYLLALGSLILVGGSLGDLYGRRRIFAIGVAGFGVASVACAVAPGVGVLVAGRALQGVFGALLVPSSLAIITATFEPSERGAAIGSWTAWTSACIAAGPPLGGLLVDSTSWRAVFALNVPLILGCLWLIDHAVSELPGDAEHRVDIPGAVLCAVGLGLPVYALIQQPTLGWSDAHVWLPLAAGGAAIVAFVVYERLARDPMLPLAIFRSRTFAVGNVATLTVYAGLGAATFFIALFLQQVASYDALEAGLSLLPISLAMILLSRTFGGLAARYGPRAFMGLGPIVGGAGLLLFARVDEHASYVTDVLPSVLLFGVGLAMTVAPLTATVLQSADPRHAGIASGVNNAVARVAGLVAIASVGAVVAVRFSHALDASTGDRPLSLTDRAYVREAGHRPLTRPSQDVSPPLRAAAQDANVAAFHTGMVVSAVLVIIGGVVSLVGIEARDCRPRRSAGAHARGTAA